ncbi:hypothetical protein [Stenotrophomonas maltophilia]|uniref:hypothetical protein n=1 Tax=Stenotrophomonas maltophilia TaxID=40324 RepID=UPI003D18A064
MINRRCLDVVNSAKRSQIISSIRGPNSQPELTSRRYLNSMRYRFRLHQRAFSGTPYFILKEYRVAALLKTERASAWANSKIA